MKCRFGTLLPIFQCPKADDFRAAALRKTMSRDDMSSPPITIVDQGDGIIGRSAGDDMYTLH
jgi:hypothetical protein